VYTANVQDFDGARLVLSRLRERLGRLRIIWGDAAYGRNGLPAWVGETFGLVLQTVLRPVGIAGFVVLAKPWVAERTSAWLGRYRRHSKDYEKTTESSEAMIYISMIALMSPRQALQKT
jgi:putative transposase